MTETVAQDWIAVGCMLLVVGSWIQAFVSRRERAGVGWFIIAVATGVVFVGAGSLADWWG